MNDDAELVRRYFRWLRSERCSAIVERGVSAVFSAARRQTHDAAQADDVMQAVFALIARRADTIGEG
jgi:DNA-directed RNA polymerase specialized sigma24 family protein